MAPWLSGGCQVLGLLVGNPPPPPGTIVISLQGVNTKATLAGNVAGRSVLFSSVSREGAVPDIQQLGGRPGQSGGNKVTCVYTCCRSEHEAMSVALPFGKSTVHPCFWGHLVSFCPSSVLPLPRHTPTAAYEELSAGWLCGPGFCDLSVVTWWIGDLSRSSNC